MAVGDKDYDWSYHTVGFSRHLVILLTVGSGPPTKSEWSSSTRLCVRAAFITFGPSLADSLKLLPVGDYSEDQVVSISLLGCVPPAPSMIPGMSSVVDGTAMVFSPISKLKSATKHTSGEQIKYFPGSRRRKTKRHVEKNQYSVGIADQYTPRTTLFTPTC